MYCNAANSLKHRSLRGGRETRTKERTDVRNGRWRRSRAVELFDFRTRRNGLMIVLLVSVSNEMISSASEDLPVRRAEGQYLVRIV